MRLALAGALLLAGCGASRDYMGIDLARVPATPSQRELQDAARGAQAGSKPEQLELGERHENGQGIPRDLDRACRLYLAAATGTGGTMMIYVPGINGAPGRVMPFTTPRVEGLPAARERLQALAYRAAISDLAKSDCLKAARG